MFRFWCPTLLAVAILSAAGCGGSEATVSGQVTVDGNPLKDGIIRFIPADGKTAVDAPVVDGKYTAVVPAGDVKVEIRGKKVVGKIRMMPESPEVDKVEELVDARFNDKSDLRMTVQRGSQEKKFEVTSRK
jgi:hypothetical protein